MKVNDLTVTDKELYEAMDIGGATGHQTLSEWSKAFVKSQKDLDKDIAEIVEKNFWKLLG